MSEKQINYPGFIYLLRDTFYLHENRTYELGHQNASITEANERLRRIQDDPEQLVSFAENIEQILRGLTGRQRQAVYLRYRLYDPPQEEEAPLRDFDYVGRHMGGRPLHEQTAAGHVKLALKNLRKFADRENGISGFRMERRRITY